MNESQSSAEDYGCTNKARFNSGPEERRTDDSFETKRNTMFKSLSLRDKLLGLCVMLSTCTAVVGGLGYYTAKAVEQLYEHVSEVNLPNATLLGEMRGEFAQIQFHIASLGAEGATPTSMEKAISEIHETRQRYFETDKKYNDIPFVPGEQELYDRMNALFIKSNELSDKIIKLSALKEPADRQALVKIISSEFTDAGKAYNVALSSLIQFQVLQSDISVAAAQAKDKEGRFLSLIFTFGSLGFALTFGFLFSNALSKALTSIAEKLSEGATDVAEATLQISGAGTELSESSTEQAAALQETVASIDEISAMISKNAENAQRSQEVAHTSHQAAAKGKLAVSKMLESIEGISRSNTDIMQQSASSNEELSNIVKVIAEIGNKTKVINDIVFQTKLLSFNASVEAARAGEHGKGFSVVAEEVGNLAQMSGTAAKEISKLLEVSIKNVENMVTQSKSKLEALISASKSKIDEGKVTAHLCGNSLDEIVINVGSLNNLVSQIAIASQEQALGVQEITKAMNQLDLVTQQNASASQESAHATDDLNCQATQLHSMVLSLVQTIHGEDNANQASRRAA